MMNYNMKIIILMILILFSIMLIIKYFFINHKNKKDKGDYNNNINLYINDNCNTEPIIDISDITEEITEEIIEDKLYDNFIIEKNIIVIHSNITI